MELININYLDKSGVIKPLNSVNNGPVFSRGVSNLEDYIQAEIPYARLHDASFYAGYGGEFTVDVHRIFRDFNADETLESSYDFKPTDAYLERINSAGTKIFYRLGASIEHRKKYGTYPPADFEKWARICEHIILHYNKGWSNGFFMGIEYWEIWNEPDCKNADGSNPCWQGTAEQFADFYCIASTYLKRKFPLLKIGGPAFASIWDTDFVSIFFKKVIETKAPLDFFSYHFYGAITDNFVQTVERANSILTSYNLNPETIINEWNYVKGWLKKDWLYTIKSEKGLKGAAFIAAIMCLGQDLPLDMLMYYDARPCVMNGLFNTDTLEPLKGYYAFIIFSKLLKLGAHYKTPYTNNDLYCCAASNDAESALMLTYYNDDDDSPSKQVTVKATFKSDAKKMARYYILDSTRNIELFREEVFTSNEFSGCVEMSLFSTVYISFTEI